MFTVLRAGGTFVKGYGLIIAPIAALIGFGYATNMLDAIDSIMTMTNPITQALS